MNIRDVLTGIYESHGSLTPEIVVDEARPETSPIHNQFEWDDQTAAESYRRVQAAHLIRSVRISFQHGDEAVSVRGFLPAHLDDDETTSAYHPTEKVFQDPVSRHVLLKEMERTGRRSRTSTGTSKSSRTSSPAKSGTYSSRRHDDSPLPSHIRCARAWWCRVGWRVRVALALGGLPAGHVHWAYRDYRRRLWNHGNDRRNPMTWIVWLLVCWNVFGIVSTVLSVGKERKTATPVVAAVAVLIQLVETALILLLGGIL